MDADPNNFRVIRDYVEYANAPYYNVATNQAAMGQTAPWHKNPEQLGQHAFKNPYEDFGSVRESAVGPSMQAYYAAAAAAAPRAAMGSGRTNKGQGRYQERSGGEGKFQQQKGGPQQKRNVRRQHTQYPYTPVPEKIEHKTISATANSVFCFHGYQSIFTLQHRFDFIVDGETYKSVDQYYQMQKVKNLTGLHSAKFTDGSTRDYSSLARDLIKQSSIKRNDVENWRTSKGLLVIQKALLEKVRQCYDLRSAITSTGDKIIVQTFAGEDFYGSGTPVKYVKDVLSGMEKNKVSLKFPMTFPITEDTVKYIPVIGKGKNVLGAIYMILREKINNGKIDTLSVDFEKSANGEPMSMDFTADSNS